MKKKLILFLLLLITIIIIVILLSIRNNRKPEPNIKNVSLVYRYTNYAWGYKDYAYLIKTNGQVLYYNYTKLKEEENVCIDMDSKEFFDDLINTTDNKNYVTQYQSDNMSKKQSELLYSINYNSIDLKYETNAIDAGTGSYYCLVEYEDYSELIKIKETGDRESTNRKRNLNKICNYIDKVVLDIKNK